MPSDKAAVSRIIEKMAALPLGETRIMEVCGTHTMAIAKSGIRSMLPGEHPPALRPRMSRVRHSCRRHRRGAGACDAAGYYYCKLRRHAARSQQRSGGQSAAPPRPRCKGRDRVFADRRDRHRGARNPEKEVVFLGVGFETTAPGTAAAVLTARERE